MSETTAPPATMILPSGCTATAAAKSSAPKKFVVVLPEEPNVGSRSPGAASTARRHSAHSREMQVTTMMDRAKTELTRLDRWKNRRISPLSLSGEKVVITCIALQLASQLTIERVQPMVERLLRAVNAN